MHLCAYYDNFAFLFYLHPKIPIILWVCYTIPFGFGLFRHIWASFFNFLNYFAWLRITDEGSVPEMRVWSILLIKSYLKWCIHFSRSLFLYITCTSTWCVSLLVDQRVPEGTCSQVLRSTSVDSLCFRALRFPVLKLI